MAHTGTQRSCWIHDDFMPERRGWDSDWWEGWEDWDEEEDSDWEWHLGWEDETWRHPDDDEFVVRSRRELLSNPSYNDVSSNWTAGRPNFLLLRKRLQDCDHNHTTCRRQPEKESFWPKRVIFVGDPNKLTLVETRFPGEEEDYLVLSHCWGVPTGEEKNRFCTTPDNYESRLRGFSHDELPKTFQDAVQVTRALQKQYLWIDALCIKQGPGGDWDSEAKTMADIFAGAYCTIAASSACGWGDGFLKPQSDPLDIGVTGTLSILSCRCDFDKDVNEGPLMKRSWVLQERVLSRRIIHFTAAHTFCECGDGVLCEQLTKVQPSFGKQYFILDPRFPERLKTSGTRRTLDFVKFLFRKYSTSGLSYATDRDVAIYSLMERMRQVLQTEVRYGIFGCFLGSLLTWRRTHDNKTPPISYKDRTVPSWSWMVYSGGIDFVSDDAGVLDIPPVEDIGFTDDGKALNAKIRQLSESCRVEQQEGRYSIVNRTEKVGFLWFDLQDQVQWEDCRYVVVGMGKYDENDDPWKTYYILIVREKASGGGYERLGVGTVEAQHVSRDSVAGTLW